MKKGQKSKPFPKGKDSRGPNESEGGRAVKERNEGDDSTNHYC